MAVINKSEDNLLLNKVSRKKRREALRKQKKINKAVNYAKLKHTNKICINNKDYEKIKCLETSKDIISDLKGKILTNTSGENKIPKKGKKKKKKNKAKISSEVEENEINSIKFTNDSNIRMLKLQEYVNKEVGKIHNEENKNDKKIKEKKSSNLIKDKLKLEDLRVGQREDEKEINSLARKMHLNAHQKKKLFPTFVDDFSLILNDIENGVISNPSFYQDNENSNNSNIDDKLENDINLLLENPNDNLQNNSRKIFSNKNKKSIGKNQNSFYDKEIDQNSVSDEDSYNSFLDDEAEEIDNDEAEEEDDLQIVNDNDLAFEGGSMIPKINNSDITQPTINSIFDAYPSNSEEESDSDLDGFIVDNDDIEYDSEISELDEIENKKLTKHSRIKGRKMMNEFSPLKESVINSPSANKRKRIESNSSVESSVKSNKKLKRKRIISESSEICSVSESPQKTNDNANVNVKPEKLKKQKKRKKKKIKIEDASSNIKSDDEKIFLSDQLITSEKKQNKSKKKNKVNSKSKLPKIDKATKEFKLSNESNENSIHEDIYGRLRDADGNILNDKETIDGKYIPPALRKLKALNTSESKREHLAALERQLKGLLNRLADSNLAGIASQIETLYQSNSRNDMNETLTKLLFEIIVTPILTPERLSQENSLLISILSANVGAEVGGHILSEFVIRFMESWEEFTRINNLQELESKELDNLLFFTVQLYNFKVVDATLVYDILKKLYEKFNSKAIEMILMVLRSVGFTLRKDNPLALKQLILDVQSKADESSIKQTESSTFTKVKFMLEILSAIRNNNINKVPNYDPSHSQHLKTLMKGIIRKGCRVCALKISLEDILKSRTQGKWWVIGSAWSSGLKELQNDRGNNKSTSEDPSGVCVQSDYSEMFKNQAKKFHLTRPPRINILFSLTEGAEDYIDSFQKLIQLNLPPSQESEIFNVLLICNEKYKYFNMFYVKVALKLLNFKKGFKRSLQFILWDKFKDLNLLKNKEITNLAKFVGYVIAEDGLNLSLFKQLDFSSADETMVTFLRQCLLIILLHDQGNYIVERAFGKIAEQPKLKLLRQCIRLFIIKFVNPKKIEENQHKAILAKRVQMALNILTSSGGVRL